MNAQDFTYWLQGFAELSGDSPPTKAQWKSIREHLALVFEKRTPPVAATPVIAAEDGNRILRMLDPSRQWAPQTAADGLPQRTSVTC